MSRRVWRQVTQTLASWNQIVNWLGGLDEALRQAV
jgi:hypothetical protein